MESARRHGERYLVLDAMRGIAAYLVVIHHATTSWVNPLGGGYLAVDFFFVLSGFVMSHAYEERLSDGLGFRRFAWARLRRLVPTMWIGTLIGAAYFFSRFNDPLVGAMLISAAFVFLPLLGSNAGLYPLDGVQWSLFFELVANAVHASLLWRLAERLLVVVALVALIVWAVGSYASGCTGVGDRTGNFILGFPRVLFGYVAGVLLYRFRERIRWPSARGELPAIGLVLLIVAASWDFQWRTQMLVTLAMPLLVLTGTRATTGLPRLCDYLGRLSFPVYAVHLPIILACSAYLPSTFRFAVEVAAVTAAAALVERLTRPGAGLRTRQPLASLEATASVS